jgi:hypothetical protein
MGVIEKTIAAWTWGPGGQQMGSNRRSEEPEHAEKDRDRS